MTSCLNWRDQLFGVYQSSIPAHTHTRTHWPIFYSNDNVVPMMITLVENILASRLEAIGLFEWEWMNGWSLMMLRTSRTTCFLTISTTIQPMTHCKSQLIIMAIGLQCTINSFLHFCFRNRSLSIVVLVHLHSHLSPSLIDIVLPLIDGFEIECACVCV